MADMSSMILSKPVEVSQMTASSLAYKNVAPAGMAIAIIREDLLGHAADTVPTMMNYTTLIGKDSMYNTPPCWWIYMQVWCCTTWRIRSAVWQRCSRSTRQRQSFCMITWMESFFANPVQPATAAP